MKKYSLIRFSLLIYFSFFIFSLSMSQGKEDFSAAKQSGTSYKTITWVGNNGMEWIATEAVGNKEIDGGAVTLRYGAIKGKLTESQKAGGVGTISFDAKIVFSDTDKDFFLLFESGNIQKRLSLGRFENKEERIHFGPFEINACEISEFEIGLNTKKGGGRLTIDNLEWTAVEDGNCDQGLVLPPNPYELDIVSPKENDSVNGDEGFILKFNFPNLDRESQEMLINNIPTGRYEIKAKAYYSGYSQSFLEEYSSTFRSFANGDTALPPTDTVIPPVDTTFIEGLKTIDDNIKVYPNPSDKCIYFELGSEKKWAEAVAVDLYGRKIKSGTIESGSSWCFDKPGRYFIRIKKDNGLLVVRKIVIR